VVIRGDTLGRGAGRSLRRAEEGLSRAHVAVPAQHGIDKVAVAVDGPAQIRPAATNFHICLLDMPVPDAGTALAVPASTKFVRQHRCEFCLPLADSLCG
jgi:hypothetical protein